MTWVAILANLAVAIAQKWGWLGVAFGQAIEYLKPHAAGAVPEGALSAPDELKRAVALVGTAVARVDDRIKAGVVMVGVPVENAPDELSNEEERQRLNNVLKAKW